MRLRDVPARACAARPIDFPEHLRVTRMGRVIKMLIAGACALLRPPRGRRRTGV